MKTEEQVNNEYQIPVLVKASNSWVEHIKPHFGRVIMCRKNGDTHLQGPRGEGQDGLGYSFASGDKDLIPWPTEAQVEAERAKLRPKADPLPGPVRQALDEAGLGCRFDGVRKLVEAIYANPPKVQA